MVSLAVQSTSKTEQLGIAMLMMLISDRKFKRQLKGNILKKQVIRLHLKLASHNKVKKAVHRAD